MKQHQVLRVVFIVIAILWFARVVTNHLNPPTWFIDGKSIVMIDFNATDQDWEDAYKEWKRLKTK